MKVGTDYDNFSISQSDFDWLGDIAQVCNEPQVDGGEPYPEEVCKRSRSLHLAGIFTMLLIGIALCMSGYHVFSTWKYIKTLKTTSYAN